MNKIKWIFFDIGSTLVDESLAYRNRVLKTISDTDITFDEFYNKMIEFYCENKKGDKEAAKYYGLKLASWNSDDEMIFSEAESCLHELSLKYKIGIIANQNFGCRERLDKFGLLKYIDVVISSAEEGIAKPDLRIFEKALEKADCTPESAVMVGDRLDNDIAPANKMGMTTVWIRQGFGGLSSVRLSEEMPDYTIGNLNELKFILE